MPAKYTSEIKCLKAGILAGLLGGLSIINSINKIYSVPKNSGRIVNR